MTLSERYEYPPDYERNSREALERALGSVPAYRGWRRLDPGPGAPIDARYAAMPELTKAMMRRHFPGGLVPAGMDAAKALADGEIEYTFTSGTTGERVVNVWSQDWWNACEAASWRLNAHTAALTYPARIARLASALNIGISCEEDLPMDHRIMGETLYLNEKTSLLQWQPRHLQRMARELAEYRPRVLEANPSLLVRLAWWAEESGEKLWSPDVIIFTYEYPSLIHLAELRKVFSSPFVSSFGSTETGFVLEECEDGLLHQNTEFCRIDFRPLKPEYGGPELGTILVTTFKNPWNAVVRFGTGDLVRLHSGPCGCGRRQGLVADAVEGRTANVTFTAAGGLVTTMALDRRLALVPGLRDYRLVQTGKAAYSLDAVEAPGASGVKAAAEAALGDVYGRDGVFTVRLVADITPGPAGKFRRTQTELDFDEEGLFE